MTCPPLRLEGVTYPLEKTIVFLCSRSEFNNDLAQDFGLLEQPIDWTYLVALAGRQGVLYLLAYNLNRIVPGVVTEDCLDKLRQDCESINRQLSTELGQITLLLCSHGIKSISYKGPTLSAILYDNKPLRVSRDLDLLVSPRDYKKLRGLLLSCGYELDYNGWYKSHFSHPTIPSNLDVHRNVVPRRHRFTLNFDDLWSRRTTFDRCSEVCVSTPCVEDLLLILCLDLVKDVAQPSELRLVKFVDIKELVCTNQDLNWDIFLRRARFLKLIRAVSFALRATDRLYGIPLPAEVRREINVQRRLTELVDKAITMIFEEQPLRYGGYFHQLNTILVLQDNVRSKIGVTVYFLLLAVKLVSRHWAKPGFLSYRLSALRRHYRIARRGAQR
jgi:Uncharacterised nucleotidyltransferase